uniref:BTB domain-containing protein n=1 Tax=Caenorhabditis tropicalis TaxID=1561998 RepID=A0A1I7TGN8_9PELO
MSKTVRIAPRYEDEYLETDERSMEELVEEVKKLHEKQNAQDLFNQKIRDQQWKTLVELQSIRVEVRDGKKKYNPRICGLSSFPAKTPSERVEIEIEQPSLFLKKFEMSHTFRNVSRIPDGQCIYSAREEHFGVLWGLEIRRILNTVVIHVCCHQNFKSKSQQILVDSEIKFTSHADDDNNVLRSSYIFGKRKRIAEHMGGWNGPFPIEWEYLQERYLYNDSLTIKCELSIMKMVGMYKKNLRCFDKTKKEFSDVVIGIDEHNFYVSKLFLASQSSNFKTEFLERHRNSSEFEISGMDPNDFQKLLEVLYGEPAIDDFNVEGILVIANTYNFNMAVRKCEEFLVENSRKSLKTRFALAMKYELRSLKIECFSEMTSAEAIRSVLTDDVYDMDPVLVSKLLLRSLSLH